ncbi:hypothetical protein JKP88DRAFT_263805 [Tribonema minus]|uniref:IGFBP N-terminal domain-containing protein n=1 Tax=Tribonema minus TaxID=303371 RepID=A0A835YUD0_9STRA|nr:hypothetical protein JKP88DRAFT_263805 [Tribonema minus]
MKSSRLPLLGIVALLVICQQAALALLCAPCRGEGCRTDLGEGELCGGACQPHGVCAPGLYCKLDAVRDEVGPGTGKLPLASPSATQNGGAQFKFLNPFHTVPLGRCASLAAEAQPATPASEVAATSAEQHTQEREQRGGRPAQPEQPEAASRLLQTDAQVAAAAAPIGLAATLDHPSGASAGLAAALAPPLALQMPSARLRTAGAAAAAAALLAVAAATRAARKRSSDRRLRNLRRRASRHLTHLLPSTAADGAPSPTGKGHSGSGSGGGGAAAAADDGVAEMA